MRTVFALVLALHALLHLMGFLKAFGLARLPQLTLPISRPMGALWLFAALLLLAATASLFASPRWFWLLAAIGLAVSQGVIAAAWSDARFGTIANAIVLLATLYGAFAWGPFGLAAEYRTRTAARIATRDEAPLLTEAELAPLPEQVQRYLRYVGVVGQPHVRGFRARFSGRIRSGPDASWMEFDAEQHNFFEPHARFFSMQATLWGLPVDALHAYDERGASMRVKLLSLFPLVDARGEDFTKAETVTLFNDICIMAPARLVDPSIRWRGRDARSVGATFSNGPHAIDAVLVFDDAGPLVSFWSDDRPALAEDGVRFVEKRWSTPISEYRAQGALRLASHGEARYAGPDGEYTYIEIDDIHVSYELTP